jgi:hypothetical protein
MSRNETSNNQVGIQSCHILNYETVIRKWKRASYQFIIPCIILFIFCTPVGVIPNESGSAVEGSTKDGLLNLFGLAEGQQAYSATGAMIHKLSLCLIPQTQA